MYECMYVHTCLSHVSSDPMQGDIRSPGTGVIDGCKLPCGLWDLNPGPLQEQHNTFVTDRYVTHQ